VVNAVTLELTPQQAERLDLARSVGTLSLVLRNQADPDPVRTGGATKASLLGTPVAAVVAAVAPAPAPAPRQRPRAVAPVERSDQIEVIRGMDRGMQQF
jgi:pilus assembly protein CpaB